LTRYSCRHWTELCSRWPNANSVGFHSRPLALCSTCARNWRTVSSEECSRLTSPDMPHKQPPKLGFQLLVKRSARRRYAALKYKPTALSCARRTKKPPGPQTSKGWPDGEGIVELHPEFLNGSQAVCRHLEGAARRHLVQAVQNAPPTNGMAAIGYQCTCRLPKPAHIH